MQHRKKSHLSQSGMLILGIPDRQMPHQRRTGQKGMLQNQCNSV
jgi:hypothetical protein